jgi:hypothetical protein
VLGEFGQAPLCLELDLDSYEGHWSHVARFRGRSGWVVGARATLESATDIFRTVIAAGCDEWDNPIPAFQAAHLLECTWSDLGPCYEPPPEILDDLLCEEEGQVYARWQRETNTALQRHLIATEDRIATLERAARRETDRLLRQIDDLRRRRRFAGLTNETRSIFDTLIAELDAENDNAFEACRCQVGRIRIEAEQVEESLWRREDVLIEVLPFCVIAWHAPQAMESWVRESAPVTRASAEMVRTTLRQQLPGRIRELELTAEAKRPYRWNDAEVRALDRDVRRLRKKLNEVRT